MSACILVVDDEPLLQDAVKSVLQSQGHDVATAGSGEEALTRIAEQAFDVIVSDIKMPGLTGLEVLKRSRALNPHVGVILMTGYASLGTAVEALRLGASDYLQKPFELDDLMLSVQRALGQHRAVETAAAPVSPPYAGPLRDAVRQFERQHVRGVLADSRFDKREAARRLGISLASLYRKLGAFLTS